MSSHTEIQPDNTDELLLAAARRARLAPLLSWAALAFGVALVIVFLRPDRVFFGPASQTRTHSPDG